MIRNLIIGILVVSLIGVAMVGYTNPALLPTAETITIETIMDNWQNETIWVNQTTWINETIWVNETIPSYLYYSWDNDIYLNATSEFFVSVSLVRVQGMNFRWTLVYYDQIDNDVREMVHQDKNTFISNVNAMYGLGWITLNQRDCTLDQIFIIDNS